MTSSELKIEARTKREHASGRAIRHDTRELVVSVAEVVARSNGTTVVMPHDLAQSVQQKLSQRSAGLWDAREVARFLGVHRNWVYLQAESGALPCVRIGGLLRFEPATIRSIAQGAPIKSGRVVALPVSHPQKSRK